MERRSAGSALVLGLIVALPVLQGCSLLLAHRQAVDATSPSPVTVMPLPPGSPVPSLAAGQLPTADQLAALLTADDFAAAGIQGAGAPAYDPDGEPGAVYAVYADVAASTGGIEVDVFVYPTPDEAASLVLDPGLWALDAATKAAIGAERAQLISEQPTNDGTASYDTLWVQKGRLAAGISVPHTDASAGSLNALATLLLARSAPYQ